MRVSADVSTVTRERVKSTLRKAFDDPGCTEMFPVREELEVPLPLRRVPDRYQEGQWFEHATRKHLAEGCNVCCGRLSVAAL
jgi:hypothetical protein